MSRDPYSTRDMVDGDLADIENEAHRAQSILYVAKQFVRAVCVLTRAVADVADATRKNPYA